MFRHHKEAVKEPKANVLYPLPGHLWVVTWREAEEVSVHGFSFGWYQPFQEKLSQCDGERVPELSSGKSIPSLVIKLILSHLLWKGWGRGIKPGLVCCAVSQAVLRQKQLQCI